MTKNYARIVDGVAVDVCSNPKEMFHPEVASQFVEVSLTVKPGYFKSESGKWMPPKFDPQSVSVSYRTLPVSEFKFLFTFAELALIAKHRADNKLSEIDAFWSIIDDPRTLQIDMGGKNEQAAVKATIDAITSDPEEAEKRKAEIFEKAQA